MGFIQDGLDEEYAEQLDNGYAYSGFAGDKLVGCAGLTQVSEKRWQVWALMAKDSGKNMVGFTRAVSKFLDENPKPRFETHVRSDFKIGKKWMKMLKFNCETPNGMKSYGDDGYDYDLYARTL